MSDNTKKSFFERMMGSAKKKTDQNRGKLEEQLKGRLKGLVYDDELVDELAPVFMGLQGQEGFEQVMELLESKESQIEYISGGDWFKQKTDPLKKEGDEQEEDHEDESAQQLVDNILSQKYGE